MAPGGQRPDLVLTDYLMPRCNGGELLRALRERWPDLPVILMSATQQTMQSLGQAGGLPFDASLVKPISLADLGATLAQLLHLRGGLGAVDEKHDRRQEVLAEQLKSLTPGQQQQLQALVEAGAVTDLIEWSRTLADSCQALAVHLRELAETGDLDSIEKRWAGCWKATSEVLSFTFEKGKAPAACMPKGLSGGENEKQRIPGVRGAGHR
ncbi:response regulator [Pseudomonas sp. 273]|uniref:response regulator n=1 Tax=Pseudomonas sp. 273 TaxID=75692 RepID=UPI0023D7EDED|nr:response regulator [Pseudomonas sp. 273]